MRIGPNLKLRHLYLPVSMIHMYLYDIYQHKHEFHKLGFFHKYHHMLEWQLCKATERHNFIMMPSDTFFKFLSISILYC